MTMKWQHSLLAMLVAAIWGANFVGSKIGMEAFPPFLYTCLRFVLVSLALIPFVPRPERKELKHIFGIALTLGTLHMSALILAIYMGLNIAGSALLGQIGVAFSCIFGYVFLKDKIGPWRITGIITAFAGMSIIAGNPNVVEHPAAFAVAIAGALFWGMANVQLKRMEGVHIFTFLAWMALLAVPMLFVVSFIFERPHWPALTAIHWPQALALCFTAFGSTLAGYGLWYWLLQRFPVSQVAPYSLLTPMFGIAFGQLVFYEEITHELLLGGAIVIIGVAIITVRRPKLLQFGEQV